MKPKGDIQFDGEIASGIENPGTTGHQVLRRVFQATQVILPGLISDIGDAKMYTANDLFRFVQDVSA